MGQILLVPARVGDATRIRDQVLKDHKVQDVAALIRQSINDPSQTMFAAMFQDDSGVQQLVAFVGLYAIESQHKNALIRCDFAEDILSDQQDDVIIQKKVLDVMLRFAFFSMHLHKVSWICKVSDRRSEAIAYACGMRQEAVLEEALCEGGIFFDAGLFSLIVSEYPDYSVAFVCFPKGVVAVRGGSEYVEGVRFYHFGEVIEDAFDRAVAIRIGLSDEFGLIFSYDRLKDFCLQQSLPSELKKAVREIREYLQKARTKFSVDIRFPFGSDFQRHVWNEIKKIPYGVTVSYEDIALSLTGDDRVSARNLSRAVGSACADNPIPIIIPCHRVIGKDGKLLGFSGGVEIKEYLLEHEIFGYFRSMQNHLKEEV